MSDGSGLRPHLTATQLSEIGQGDTVRLRGKTLKGKNRVRQHGDEWFVRERDRSVIGRNLGLLVCPSSAMQFVTPPNPDFPGHGYGQNEGHCRWVHPTRDPDFEVLAPDVSLSGAPVGGSSDG